jgi:hypothetical protein
MWRELLYLYFKRAVLRDTEGYKIVPIDRYLHEDELLRVLNIYKTP